MTAPPFRVLVVGGAGVFGRRLVDAILATTEWSVVVAGRSRSRCEAVIAGRPRLSSVVLDTWTCTPDQLAASGACVVVDAAGPFQGARYGLPSAAIAAGLHYVDIADGRDFVAGFGPALDLAARAAGVVALTGASSTPALSNAALDAITAGWQRIDTVTVAISPGNRAPRGVSVVRAILSYAGHRVRVFAGGRWTTAPGWGLTRHIVLPGVGRRWVSLCETPDLDILPARFRVRDTALFLAGLELPVLHLGLVAASWPVRAGWLGSLRPLTPIARGLAMLLAPFGTDRGGMVVMATGQDPHGHGTRAQWSLAAEGGDGPSIPTLPALVVLRRLADGRLHQPGAGPCVGQIGLAEIEAEMVRYRITTQQDGGPQPPPLFQRALGPAFAALPPAVRELHAPEAREEWSGIAMVQGATSTAGRLVARLGGLPAPGTDIQVRVTIAADPEGETWSRCFAGRHFHSRLTPSHTPGQVLERFGPFRFALQLGVTSAGIGMAIAGWWFGPIPMPRWLAIVSTATETVDEAGRFRFDVSIDLPLSLGRVTRYTGFLVPEGPLDVGAAGSGK